MIQVLVTDKDGVTSRANDVQLCVIRDQKTGVPIAMVSRVGEFVEILTLKDGQRFKDALANSTYASQRGDSLPENVVLQGF